MQLDELQTAIKARIESLGWVETGLLRWPERYQCPVYAKDGRNVAYLDMPRLQGERNTYTEATCGKRGLSGRGAEAFVPAVAAYLKAQHPKTLFLVMVACCPLDSHDLLKSRLSVLNVTCSIHNHPDRTFVENFPGGSKEVFALVFMVNEIVKSFDNP